MEEQIIATLKEQAAGMKTAEVCRRPRISQPTLYSWKSKCGGLEVSYAAHAGWLEDHRRESNGQLADRLIRNALQTPVSLPWNGYWQRAA